MLLLSQITSEGSFSASPNGSPSKSRTKTGVPVKSMFEGVQFTANPLSDYQGFEKKTKLWQMYEFFFNLIITRRNRELKELEPESKKENN